MSLQIVAFPEEIARWREGAATTRPAWVTQKLAELSELPVQECGGEIVATIDAVDEPFFGGTTAGLLMTFTCLRCKNTNHPGVPEDSKELSAFVTRAIAAL